MTVPAGLTGRLDGPAVAPAVDVVALVTSAGGLDALSAVLRELPEDFPAAERRNRETEARLADQDRLRSMVNIPGVGVLTWEPTTGTLLDANDGFLDMSGYTRQEVGSGQITWRGLTPEEQVAESERQMEQLARTGRIGPYEKDLIRADGSRSRMLHAGAGMSDQTAVEYCIDPGPRC